MKIWNSLAATLLVAVLLAGCGGKGEQTIGKSEAGSAARADKDTAGTAAGQAGDTEGTEGTGARLKDLKVVQQERAIVYTADLEVRAADASTTRAKQIVEAAGGYLAKEESFSAPDAAERRATLELKVPPDRYKGVLDQLSGLGKRTSLTQQSNDVTEQVADVNSRIKSAEAALARLRTLLSRADAIGEVISVEREISQRESDLEALQARQRALAHQTSFATITLHLIAPPAKPAPPAAEPQGFLTGLLTGWRALLALLNVLLVAVGAVLPFAAVALAGWFAARQGLKLRRRRVRPLPASPHSERT